MRRLTRRQRIAALVLAMLAVCFITLDLGGGGLEAAHSGVRGAFGALYRGTDSVIGPVRRFVQGVPTAGRNEAKIQQLRHTNEQLRGRLAAANAAASTSRQVARLRSLADTGHYKIVPATVQALGSGGGFDWTATLDVGRADGILVGQTVTDGYGLVGRVLDVNSYSCVVLLAADSSSGVGARDLRTGQIGLVSGHGTSGLRFAPLDPNATVRVGDRLVTGPSRASSFVAGLSIGTVTSVTRGPQGSTAVVRPTVSPTSLDTVGVILVGGQRESGRTPMNSSALAGGK